MVHSKRSHCNEKPSAKPLLERSPLLAAPRASLCTARKTQHNLKQINTLKIKTNKQTKKPALSLRAQRTWRLGLTGPQTHKEIQRGKEKGGQSYKQQQRYRMLFRSEKHRGRQPGAVCTQAQVSQTRAARISGPKKKKQNCKKSYNKDLQQRNERNEHRQTKNSPG